MEGSVLTHEGSVEETRKVGVKTKSGCEEPFAGQILPPRGGVSISFSENSSDLSDNFCHPAQRKVRSYLSWRPLTLAGARIKCNEREHLSR